MKFKSLTLKNYRKYQKAEFRFQDGITAIIGKNGTGKSTIFEAILFALFGPIAIRGDKKVVRNRLNPTEKTEAILEFEIFGDTYVAHRIVKGKNDTIASSLLKEGKEVAKNNKAVNDEIKKIFGIDYKSFEISIFAKQGEISSLSSMENSERRSVIPKLVRIDDIDKAVKSIKEDKKELSIQLEAWGKSMDDPKVLKEEIASTQSKLKSLEKSLTQRDKELTSKKAASKSLSSEIDTIKDNNSKIATAKKEFEIDLENFRGKKQELTDIKSKVEEVKSLKLKLEKQNKTSISERLEFASKQLEDTKVHEEEFKSISMYKRTMEEMIAAKSAVEKAELELDQINTNPLPTQEKIKEVQDKIREAANTVSSRIAVVTSKIEFHTSEINRLEDSDQCPTCGSEDFSKEKVVYGHEDSIDKLKSEKRTLEKKKIAISEKSSTIDSKAKQVKKLEEQRKHWKYILEDNSEKITSRQDRLKDELEESYNKISSVPLNLGGQEFLKLNTFDYCIRLIEEFEELGPYLKESSEKLSRQVKELSEQMSSIEVMENTLANLKYTIETGKRLKTELEELKSKIEDQQKVIKSMDSSVDTFDKEEELKSLNEEIEIIDEDVSSLKLQIGIKNNELKTLDSRLEKVKEVARERKEKEKQVLLLGTLIDEMNSFKINLLSRIRPQLNQVGSKLLEEITNGKYQKVELSEDYDISVYSFGQKEDLTTFYSGGEMHLVNICMRVAISKLIAHNFRCLVLDEIFGFQDSDRQPEIVSSLKKLIGANFDQILIITHNDFVREKSDHIIKIQETNDGSNEVVYF